MQQTVEGTFFMLFIWMPKVGLRILLDIGWVGVVAFPLFIIATLVYSLVMLVGYVFAGVIFDLKMFWKGVRIGECAESTGNPWFNEFTDPNKLRGRGEARLQKRAI